MISWERFSRSDALCLPSLWRIPTKCSPSIWNMVQTKLDILCECYNHPTLIVMTSLMQWFSPSLTSLPVTSNLRSTITAFSIFLNLDNLNVSLSSVSNILLNFPNSTMSGVPRCFQSYVPMAERQWSDSTEKWVKLKENTHILSFLASFPQQMRFQLA